jgi:outer membrane protein insertion porin family
MARVLNPVARIAAVALYVLLAAGEARAQAQDLIDRPIADIRIEGLVRVDPNLVLNQIRAAAGEPYDPDTVRGDVRRLTRLGEFKFVDAEAKLQNDGTVLVVYRFVEQALITEVQVVGNKVISDQELIGVVQLFPQGPRDDFLIEQAIRSIEQIYREKGHYLATVAVDDTDLDESGILIFRVIEGPRVRVKAIEFLGNDSISSKMLRSQLRTETYIFIFRKGELNKEVLFEDIGALDKYYKDQGFLDVRVDRTIELSPDNTEAKVTFLIAEGEQFTLGSVQAVNGIDGGPLRVFTTKQIAAMLAVKTGDIYGQDLVQESVVRVADAYERLSYFPDTQDLNPNTRIRTIPLRRPDEPVIDLLLEIDEGTRYRVGSIEIGGNFLTRDRVIRRLVRLDPGRPFDVTEITASEERLRQTDLFGDVRITVQDPTPEEPDIRDVLVEVKESNTGSIAFGVGFGSDQGVFGSFSVTQRNFDITDFPESFRELIEGRAFRGAGQGFNFTIRPGNEIFEYGASWTEPHMLGSDYSFSINGGWRRRRYRDYTEDRVTIGLPVGRRLGDIWQVAVSPRFERAELVSIDPNAPREIFADAGPSNLYGLAFTASRMTADDPLNPTRGSRLSLVCEPVIGDYEFASLEANYTVFFTLTEDFLRRRTTLKLSGRMGYIFGGTAPTYERYYLGGRSLRGFEFRTVSPKGTKRDGKPSEVPIGGSWMMFLGAQYQFPIFEKLLAGVFFVDSGTVLDSPGLTPYRLSLGAGVRLSIPALSPVPIALDFGFPILKEPTDQDQTFSFSAEFPF